MHQNGAIIYGSSTTAKLVFSIDPRASPRPFCNEILSRFWSRLQLIKQKNIVPSAMTRELLLP